MISRRVTRERTGRKLITGIAALALVGGVLGVYATALAVHNTGNFELDGDAVASTSDDWNEVCFEVTVTKDTGGLIPDECAGAGNTTGSTAVAWTSEPDTSASIFTGGGSKDPIDISSWAWKNAGGLPDKDNLTHAFAARYVKDPDSDGTDSTLCPAGSATKCDILYFGSDRFDNSGDAQQGFWFFQNKITQSDVKSGGGFKFNGVHRNGDLLVISDFSNGGTVSTITVYKWNTAVAGNLELLLTSLDAKCPSAGPEDAACGIVNATNGTTAPWSFTDKSGNGSFLNGEFYEGAINLSTLGLANECFATVASETRSSTSTTATLKDFVLAQFANCSATLTTQVQNADHEATTSVNPGVPVHDLATVTGTNAAVTPTGDVTWFMCSFAAGSTDACSGADTAHTGTQLGSAVTLSGSDGVATAESGTVNTPGSPLAPGRYCFRAEYPGDGNYVGALKEFSVATECFTVVQSPSTVTTTPKSGTSSITAPVAVGTSVTDYARVDGATGFGSPTGTVTFYVCSPSAVTGTGTSAYCAAGTQVGTAAVTVTAIADSSPPATEATSAAVTANAVGVWCFRAVYTPDTAKYTGDEDSANSECFTVRDSTSVSTAQDWLPNDTATVTATGGTALNGTLTFELHASADCSGPAVAGQTYTRTLTDATTLADRTKSTGNSTYFVTADATVSWKVTFVPSSGSFVDAPTSTSCEVTSLDLTQ